MKMSKVAPFAVGLATMIVSFAPAARADQFDKKTTFTFSAPVEIPPVHLTGMNVLPAGTYVFKLVDSNSNRHIVQIFNKEETQVFATILAIPNYRLQPTDKTVLTFNEGPRGTPETLRAWFYPGASWGEEFVYPKTKAVELAKVTNVPVLALQADVTIEAVKPDEPRILAQLAKAPVVAVKPTGEVVELAQVIQTTPRPSTSSAQISTALAATSLPSTASPLPMIALFGLLALSGAFAVRVAQKRLF